MRQRIWWGATSALVIGGLLSLSGVGFGGENQNPNKSARSASEQSNPSGGGVATQPAALGVFRSQSESRVHVSLVMPGAPAALAGLRSGDEIRFVDDQRIRAIEELTEEILARRPGSQVALLILRNGERELVKATLASVESVFGKRDHQSRRSNAYSYRPISRPADESEQALREQVGALNQEISRLQRQIDETRSNQNDRLTLQEGMQSLDWGWNERGFHNDDPAAFQ